MSARANYFTIGLFTIIAFAIGIAAVVIFGSGVLRKETYPFVITFENSVNGLRSGSKVKASGIEIGVVKDVLLYADLEGGHTYAPTIIELDMEKLAYSTGLSVEEMEVVEFFDTEISKGLSGRLQIESLVTGTLYIELHFSEDGEGFILDDERFSEYRAIPSVAGGLEEAKWRSLRLLENLASADLAGLAADLRDGINEMRSELKAMRLTVFSSEMTAAASEVKTFFGREDLATAIRELSFSLESLRGLIEKFEGSSGSVAERIDGLSSQLERTLREVEGAASNASQMMDPSSLLYTQASESLEEVYELSRALKDLVEYLERNPSALLKGRAPENE